MSRELFILRHAKSDWGSGAEVDQARPLNKRGRKDAHNLGVWMREQYLYPARVYCSTAKRARETLEYIEEELQLKADSIEYLDRLYLAALTGLLKLLSEIPPDCNSAMLVGHNPGLDDLVRCLSRDPVPLSKSGKLMTTACLVQFKLPDDWHDLAGKAELVRIIRPSELDN